MSTATERTLPALDANNNAFWTSGKNGRLCLGSCGSCSAVFHPSITLCPSCLAAVEHKVTVSGCGIVAALTHNHQPWPHAPKPPYIVAIVVLVEAPHVRLTTNLVNCDAADCHVGMGVRVVFQHCGDVWLPLFEPEPDMPAVDALQLARVPSPAIRTSGAERFEHRVAITGIGASDVARRLTRAPMLLVTDACRRAMDDAGLSAADIDGVCAYPGTPGLPGLSEGGIRELVLLLGLTPLWHNGAAETPGQTGAVAAAMLAVASGLCRHVLCFTGVAQSQRPAAPVLPNGRVAGEMQWQLPFGSASPANWIALYASHYMARYDMRRETLGWLAIAARAHAQRNPGALYTTALTMDAYLAARTVCTPFGLNDCDVPCDGAWAVVVSCVDAAAELRQPPIRVDAIGTAISEPQSWDQGTLTHQPHLFSAAAHLWQRSRFKPADVDVALLYDGFTFNAMCWLEALGFCKPGEGAAFVEGGTRIGPGGSLPLNPHGGQLNCGRANGFGHLLEAVTQLRGQAGDRQVAHAAVAVCSSGGGIPAGCMLLHSDT